MLNRGGSIHRNALVQNGSIMVKGSLFNNSLQLISDNVNSNCKSECQ